jgi:hypothetical protein
MDNIATVLVQALLSSVLFVVAFLIIRAVFSLVIHIVASRKLKNKVEEFAREDRTGERKKEKLLSVIAGALCGVIVTAALTSPVLGIFDILHSFVEISDKTEMDLLKSFKLKDEQVRRADRYSRNFPSVFVYSMGGRMIYTATATATVNGKLVSVPIEISTIERSMDDVKSVIGLFQKEEQLSESDFKLLEKICTLSDDSVIFANLLTEYVQKGTQSWLDNSSFMSVPTPKVGARFNALFTEVLRACASTGADTVGDDMRTLVRIYSHMLESADYHNALFAITNSDMMMNIGTELRKNNRMNNAYIRDELYDVVVIAMAATMAIDRPAQSGYDQYIQFMENMAKSANTLLTSNTMTRDQMITQMARDTDNHCRELGFEFSFSALKIVSEAIIDTFSGSDEPLSSSSMIVFFGGSITDKIE